MSRSKSNKPNHVERFVDAFGDLLEKRALSIGLIDLNLEINGPHVDAEFMFSQDPDLGLSLNTDTGDVSFCRLIGADTEQWLEHPEVNVPLSAQSTREDLDDLALFLLNALLDIRRPLLRKP